MTTEASRSQPALTSRSALQSLRGRIPVGEYAFPGPVRDGLVAAILNGEKTATTSLLVEYQRDGQDPHDLLGSYELVVDSDEQPVCVTRTTEVRVVALSEVDLQHCIDEGEGYRTIAEWERAHRLFWESEELRAELNDPTWRLTDRTPVVMQRFELVDPHEVRL
nr:ASCH domain-containing protein [Corynebacterium ciconiae]